MMVAGVGMFVLVWVLYNTASCVVMVSWNSVDFCGFGDPQDWYQGSGLFTTYRGMALVRNGLMVGGGVLIVGGWMRRVGWWSDD